MSSMSRRIQRNIRARDCDGDRSGPGDHSERLPKVRKQLDDMELDSEGLQRLEDYKDEDRRDAVDQQD